MPQKQEKDPREYCREAMGQRTAEQLRNRQPIPHDFKSSPLFGAPLICLDPIHNNGFQVISENECEFIKTDDQEEILN